MMTSRNRPRLRLLSVPLACVLGTFSLVACAEIEVGAEAAKRVGRVVANAGVAPALQPSVLAPSSTDASAGNRTATQSDEVRVAQAAQTNDQALPISPFLAPAPEIFEATGLAIWDGKRTLQGVWVAHPLATSARRVRIFNQGNGQAVDGALFKRDAASGGASVLISSEAAQLLNMDVGTPAELRIVAVSPIQRAPEVAEPAETVAIDETAQPVESETAAAAEAPKDQATQAEIPTVAPTPATKPKPTATWKLQTEDEAPAQPAPSTETKTAAAKPAEPVKPPKPSTPAKASTLKQPFIQAGIFSVSGNAAKLIRRIQGKNIPAVGRQIKYRGKTATKVLAGPFQTTSERSAALKTIRGALGIKDATPVRR